MTTTPKTLATGAALTAASFQDFVNRLKHHCEGAGLQDHGTANAVFEVHELRTVTGIDRDYVEEFVIIHEDSQWKSLSEFRKDVKELGVLDELNKSAQTAHGKDFDSCDETEQLELIEELDGVTVTGYVEQWHHIGSHLTPEAAQAFIDKKHRSYGELRISVESSHYDYELNSIREALLSGRLIYVDGPTA